MTITNEQRELLATIMENKDNLEELLKLAAMERKQAKDLHMKDSITVAGITWSKFAEDADGNAYLLADKCTDHKKFGDNNDWRENPIRKDLNDDLCKKIVAELGKNAIVPITVDLFSHDGLRDYGMCEDMVSIPTFDLYRNNRENIKDCGEWFWMCTPDSTPSGCGSVCVRYVGADGDVGCSDCDWNYGSVRPFFILKSSIFVSCDKVEE